MAKFYTGRIPSGKCGYTAYACDTDALPEYAVIGNPDCVLASRKNYYRLARKIKGLVSDVDYFDLADVFSLLSGVTEACDTSYDPNDSNGLFVDANGSFTTGLPIDNPIDPTDDCFSTEIEYTPGAVDPVENIQSITLDNYPWANYWDFDTVPPILDSNTAPDVEMDCPFQVMEADGGGYYVAGSPKNVTQVLQNGAPIATIVDSTDSPISAVSDSVYLKLYKDNSEWTTTFTGGVEPGLYNTYFIKIATISITAIENLFCSSIVVSTDSLKYDGLFAVSAIDSSTVLVKNGVIITGTAQSDIDSTTLSVSDGTCIYLNGMYVYAEDSFNFEILTESGYPEQVWNTIRQPIALINIADNVITVTQLQYGIMYIYGRGTV